MNQASILPAFAKRYFRKGKTEDPTLMLVTSYTEFNGHYHYPGM
jgi:hypothetical protein